LFEFHDAKSRRNHWRAAVVPGTVLNSDDNFVSLLPGESRTIRVAFSDTAAELTPVPLLLSWNAERKWHRPKTD